jgi:hypothetical protein
MSASEQFLCIVRRLSEDNLRLQRELCGAKSECRELRGANANLQVERDAADVLLGEAMDQLLDRSQR